MRPTWRRTRRTTSTRSDRKVGERIRHLRERLLIGQPTARSFVEGLVRCGCVEVYVRGFPQQNLWPQETLD